MTKFDSTKPHLPNFLPKWIDEKQFSVRGPSYVELS